MPAPKQTTAQKPKKADPKDRRLTQVERGTSSAVTKEAVKVYAEQHRAAMIRLANR